MLNQKTNQQMKQLFLIAALFGTLSISAQVKPDAKAQGFKSDAMKAAEKQHDTLSVPSGTKVVKIGDQVFELKPVIPGVFALDFDGQTYNILSRLLNCSGTQAELANIRSFLEAQLKAQGLLKQ
jgi:hypothetical protein